MSKDEKPEVEEETEEVGPKKTSLVVQIVVFLLITAIAAGSGFGVSMFLESPAPKMEAKQDAADMESAEGESMDKEGAEKAEKGDKDEEDPLKNAYAKPLAPILTNLAAPEDVWVRMELAVVGKPSLTDAILEQIHQDLFAYMRTVKLHHVEGPSGYQNLRAELSERAAIRSGGTAQSILVRTLVFE